MKRQVLHVGHRAAGFWVLLALSFVVLVGACSGDDSDDQTLRPAGEVIAEGEADRAVRGEIGEPSRLTSDLGQDVAIVVRSAKVGESAEGGRRLIVDVRVENDTDEDQDAPEIELWCGDMKQPFYSEGTFRWATMPASTFLEGTREFAFPTSCNNPELRAVPLVHRGESVRWDVTPG